MVDYRTIPYHTSILSCKVPQSIRDYAWSSAQFATKAINKSSKTKSCWPSEPLESKSHLVVHFRSNGTGHTAVVRIEYRLATTTDSLDKSLPW